MENSNKRQYRQLDDETKQKISNSMKGKTKTADHALKISQGVKAYWSSIPNQPNGDKQNPITTGQII